MIHFHFLIVLVHRFLTNTKTFKTPNKVEAYANDVPMCLNDNALESVVTNKNEVHNDQHATAPAQIYLTPGSLNHHSSLATSTSRYSTSNCKESSSVTHPRKNKVTITSYPLRKGSIFPREGAEPHVTKHQY